MTDGDKSVIRQIVEESVIRQIVEGFGKDRGRLLAIVHALQESLGYLSDKTIDALAAELGIHRVEVVDVASFYAFLNREPKGQVNIRLAKTPISMMNGAREVAQAFEETLGMRMGQTSHDGRFSLSWTSDIGMADQEPSALVNWTPLTRITVEDVPKIVAAVRTGASSGSPQGSLGFERIGAALPDAVGGFESGASGQGVVHADQAGPGLRAALNMTPEQVVGVVIKSKLRGRGGAGFPTGLKWKLCRQARGETRYVLGNADEGEPGTFKDRVLLTEVPDRVFSGMTIAGYALGAREGIMYLRAEYAYLWGHLQHCLEQRRKQHLLGDNICGREDFSFDIRIELGAGAYICGEESSLIQSLEGKRGSPRDRPPFPTDKGYNQLPTSVNNIETLACVARILEMGARMVHSVRHQGIDRHQIVEYLRRLRASGSLRASLRHHH